MDIDIYIYEGDLYSANALANRLGVSVDRVETTVHGAAIAAGYDDQWEPNGDDTPSGPWTAEELGMTDEEAAAEVIQ